MSSSRSTPTASNPSIGDPAAARSRRDDGAIRESLTIGELAEITGLSVSAIRFYQRRGLLPARSAESGWQRYGDDTLARLAVIELAKSAGFNLDEVIRVLDAMKDDPDTAPDGAPIWQGLAEAKLADIDSRILRLQQMRRLLSDSLARDGLTPDRIRHVPAELGWTAGPLGKDPDRSPAGTAAS